MKNKSKKVFIIISIIVFVLLIIFFIKMQKQINYIKNSDLIIESNYQNGIIISEDSIYAISENFCKEITIPINLSNYYSKDTPLKSYEYSIKYNTDTCGDYEIDSYTDPELTQIDEEVVKNIIFDAKKNHNNLNKNFSNPNYKKDITTINNATLTHFANSDYYHISIGYNDSDNMGGYTVVNEMIYKGERYIDELLIHGNITSVINIKK